MTNSQPSTFDTIWRHPWGRVAIIALTVALVSWALRETATITLPIARALGQVMLPVAIGFTIAYIVNPVIDALARRQVPRLLAASLLFMGILAAAVVTTSLLLPAVIRQTADLASRSVLDLRYFDRDGDGRLGPNDLILTEVPGSPGLWFHDRNVDGKPNPGELQLRDGDQGLIIEPSVAARVSTWFDGQQGVFDRWLGTDIDERAPAFLALYRDQTAPIRSILDAGLAAARDGLPPERWPESWRIAPSSLPPLSGGWERSWLGVLPSEVDAARAALPETARERWDAVLDWYGRLHAERQRQLLMAWDLLLHLHQPTLESEREHEGASEATAERLLEAVAAETKPLAGEPGRLLALLAAEGPDVLLERLRERLEGGRDRNDSMSGRDLRILREELDRAEAAELAWSKRLLDRLRRPGDGGHAVLREAAQRFNDEVRGAVNHLPAVIAGSVGSFVANVGGLLETGLNLVLIPIYAFFLALAMPGIRRTVAMYLPATGRERSAAILHGIERVVAAFFRGRLIVCAICAVLAWLLFALLSVPYAGLFGLLIGLATAVPLAGLVFLVPAMILSALDGGDGMILRLCLIAAAYGLIQTLEMTVFTPTIMGREVELHPVVLIVALILCGKLLGVLGLILAVPIAATFRILAREFLLPRLRHMAALPEHSRVWKPPTADELAPKP